MFVSGLEGAKWYWSGRSVDEAGNVVTSPTVSTAINYLTNPEAGWCAAVSVKTVLVGATDIAFGVLTSDHIKAGSLDASVIGAGTLVVRPLDSFARGVEVRSSTPAPPASGTLLGRWDENGIKLIDPADSRRYVLMAAGEVKFTEDAGATFPAITPEGVNATAVTFGVAQGGHNLVLNSSFELAGFGAAAGSTSCSPTRPTGRRPTAPCRPTTLPRARP